MKRFLWLGFVVLVYGICTGCGDTFRPIIIPNPPVFPNPAAAHTVVTISDNGTIVPGSAMVTDVSGDTDLSIGNTDIHPVHAVQQTGTQVLVVNQAVSPASVGSVPTSSCLVTIPVDGVLTTYDVCPSISKLDFSNLVISSTSTISLPIYAGSNFIAVAPSSTTAYVTMPTYPPDPTHPLTIVPSVGVVSTLSDNVVATIPVGLNPYALAVTPDNTKLYVANQGDGTISGFNTVDRSQRTISPSGTSSPPIWLQARSDSQKVYVLEQTTGTLASIDTTSTAGPDVLTETSISVPTAQKLTYDSNLNRLYIPGEAVVQSALQSAVVIVDVSQSPPAPIATVPITAILPNSRATQDPCSATAVTTLNTVDVAALPDGSRAYAGTYYEDTAVPPNICPQVTVIDAVSNTVKSTIAIPGFPAYDAFCGLPVSQQGPRFRIMMAAGGDSSRAYMSSCDGGMVNIIDTSTDTYILNLAAPASTRPPIPPNLQNPPQNPVFLIAGP